jgi:hypothetical protein
VVAVCLRLKDPRYIGEQTKTTCPVVLLPCTVQNSQIYGDGKQTNGCLGCGREDREQVLRCLRFPFGVVKTFWNLIVVVSVQFCDYFRNHISVHFKRVTLCM